LLIGTMLTRSGFVTQSWLLLNTQKHWTSNRLGEMKTKIFSEINAICFLIFNFIINQYDRVL